MTIAMGSDQHRAQLTTDGNLARKCPLVSIAFLRGAARVRAIGLTVRGARHEAAMRRRHSVRQVSASL